MFVDRSYIGLFKRQSRELAVPDGKVWHQVGQRRQMSNKRHSQLSDVMDAEVLTVKTCKRHKSNQSLQGQRTLSLLVENFGRVHQGKDLDKQHKGDRQTVCSLLCVLLNHSRSQCVVYKPILICVLAGLVGDVLLNNIPLRDFTIYSLDMKPSFIDRFVRVIEFKALHITFILM